MKRKLAILAALAAGAWAADRQNDRAGVTICVTNYPATDYLIVRAAEYTASRIYEAIGVSLIWSTGACAVSEESILVSYSEDSREKYPSAVMAYALPYEGKHIVLLSHHIRGQVSRAAMPAFLGHVLAHEIGHVLEGTCRHAETGIMKPSFGARDQYDMRRGNLRFTGIDVSLIQAGVRRRERHGLAEKTAAADDDLATLAH